MSSSTSSTDSASHVTPEDVLRRSFLLDEIEGLRMSLGYEPLVVPRRSDMSDPELREQLVMLREHLETLEREAEEIVRQQELKWGQFERELALEEDMGD